MKTCLIVIDAQESFRQRPYWDESLAAPYLAAQNALIAGAAEAGLPIVRRSPAQKYLLLRRTGRLLFHVFTLREMRTPRKIAGRRMNDRPGEFVRWLVSGRRRRAE